MPKGARTHDKAQGQARLTIRLDEEQQLSEGAARYMALGPTSLKNLHALAEEAVKLVEGLLGTRAARIDDGTKARLEPLVAQMATVLGIAPCDLETRAVDVHRALGHVLRMSAKALAIRERRQARSFLREAVRVACDTREPDLPRGSLVSILGSGSRKG